MATNPHTTGQQFVSATVHLAGAVEVETGHQARYTAQHVQARIGGVLLYFLDRAAVADFARAVAATAEYASAAFGHPHAVQLPEALHTRTQDVSLVVRLQGAQTSEPPRGVTAGGSVGGHGHISCTVGGLRLVLHDAEALHRLVRLAHTVERVAVALWPDVEVERAETHDGRAEQRDQELAHR